MAKVISLSKEEKLAILRVIIELNNTYDIRFSDDVFKFIQRVSIELTTPNSLYWATNISFLEAKNILTKSFENDSAKKEMLKELKVLVRDEIKRELHSGMKNFVHENFNETLYKDL